MTIGEKAVDIQSGIYCITNKVNGKRYFGSSNNISRRWAEHLKTLRNKSHCNKKLQRAFNKYGAASFVFSVVELCSCDQLIDREQSFIDDERPHKNGYNISPFAASGFRGRNWSDEERAKQSIRMKERLARLGNPFKGRHHSEEVKKILSLANKGKQVGVKNPFFGKNHSEKTKAVMAQRHAESKRMSGSGNVMFGKNHTESARQKIATSRQKTFMFLNPNGVITEITNLKKYCRDSNLNSGAMFSVLMGRVNHHKGWKKP